MFWMVDRGVAVAIADEPPCTIDPDSRREKPCRCWVRKRPAHKAPQEGVAVRGRTVRVRFGPLDAIDVELEAVSGRRLATHLLLADLSRLDD